MAFATYIPGMAPGQTPRNIAVSVLYLVCFPLIPVVLALAVFSNYNRVTDRLARRNTPGFSPGGGVMPAAVTFLALSLMVILLVGLSVGPLMVLGDSGETDSSPEETTGDSAIENDTVAREDEAEVDSGGDSGFAADSVFGDDDRNGEELPEEEKVEYTTGAFQQVLTDQGYEVIDVSMENGVLDLEYRTYAETVEEIDGEIWDIVLNYVNFDDILQNEMAEEQEGVYVNQTEGLDATAIDFEGEEKGSFFVEGDSARDIYAGDISDEEFQDRVEETIELSDDLEGDSN